MNAISRLAAALLAAASAAACTPAGDDAPSPPAASDESAASQNPSASRESAKRETPKVTEKASEGGGPELDVQPVPDVDSVTGIDRNVTYELQVEPERGERTRKEPQKSPPDD